MGDAWEKASGKSRPGLRVLYPGVPHTTCLARELSDFTTGITAIAPGFTHSEEAINSTEEGEEGGPMSPGMPPFQLKGGIPGLIGSAEKLIYMRHVERHTVPLAAPSRASSVIRRQSERILPRGALHADPAQLGKFFQRCPAPEPAPAAIFYSSKRDLRLVMHGLVVDVDHA